MSSNTIVKEIWIDAGPAKVWDALTDPVQIEQWFSPGTPWVLSASAVGGRLFVRDPATGGELYTQVIVTMDPPTLLVLETLPAPSQPTWSTRYDLIPEGRGTTLRLTYAGFDGLDPAIRTKQYEQTATGFGLMVGNIKAVLEGTPLPNPGGF